MFTKYLYLLKIHTYRNKINKICPFPSLYVILQVNYINTIHNGDI